MTQAPSWRERLGERLADYPLLRTLLFNPWFALAFSLVSLLALTAVISLPKFWVSTPPGIQPVMRVSLLDRVQARSLRAAAERHAAAGRHREAAQAWQGAVMNDPGNLELHRAMFRHLAGAPLLPLTQVSRGFYRVNWMLQLSGTNRADLELAARALDHYGLAEDVFSLLEPTAGELSPSLEPAYLKALFQVGRYEEFGRRWDQRAAGAAPSEDPPLTLCRAAYLAGWGPAEEAPAQRARLRAALEDPELGSYACRLEMTVAARLLDPEGYRAAMQRLELRGEDRATDHARYWRLLKAAGRVGEARALVRSFNRPPDTAFDVVQVADALNELDLKEDLLAFLQRHVLEFGYSPNVWSVAVWSSYVDALVAGAHWEQLREAARQMRLLAGNQAVLGGFSHFLEGWVLHEQGAGEAARTEFLEAIRLGFPIGRVGLGVALRLLQLGYPDLALQTLLPLESRFDNDLTYWRAVFHACYLQRQDETLLLRAAMRAHEVAPDSPEWRNNYAAALLINQRRPEQAVALTLAQLLAEGTRRQPGTVINHAVALSLNRRFDEAADLLREVDPDLLTPMQREAHDLAWLQIHHAQGRWAEVRRGLDRLREARLFPGQQRWLEGIRRDLLEAEDRATVRAGPR